MKNWNLIDIEYSFDIHVGLEPFFDPVRMWGQPFDELAFILVAADDHGEEVLVAVRLKYELEIRKVWSI